MLRRNGEIFCASVFHYVDEVPGREEQQRIGIEIHGVDGQVRRMAAVDTGATWSLMSRKNWTDLDLGGGADLILHDEPYNIGGPASTPVDIYKTCVVLSSTQGEELAIEGVCIAVTDEWKDPIILGLTNMLDRIRFAVDPSQGKFYFGSTEDDPS